MQNLSWYAKYQPKTVDDYVFEDELLKTQVHEWISQGYIPGNVLLYGKAGLGKSALAEILIRSTIKSAHDLKKMRTRSVEEVDGLFSWLQKAPVASKRKIVLFEEMDRISSASVTQLKTDVMEKFQSLASFIATTNYISKLDPALVSRFTFKIELKGINVDGIVNRLKQILSAEEVSYNEEDLVKFVKNSSRAGMRNLITALQANTINNTIDFASIDIGGGGSSEDKIVDLTMDMFKIAINSPNINEIKSAAILPINSQLIGKQYAELSEILQFNQNIDYDVVFELLIEKINFVPIKMIASEYYDTMEHRKMQNIAYQSFIHEGLIRIIDFK